MILKTIDLHEAMFLTLEGERAYMLMPITKQTTVEQLFFAEGLARLDAGVDTEPDSEDCEDVNTADPEEPEVSPATDNRIDHGKICALYKAK